MLVLYRVLAGGHHIVTARRGALQRVNRVLRSLPRFVVSEILGHVVKIFLFSGQRRFKDAFGLLDQRQSSLDFRATLVIHNPLLPGRRVISREQCSFPAAAFNKSLVESGLSGQTWGSLQRISREKRRIFP
jgi:hypothetical protein